MKHKFWEFFQDVDGSLSFKRIQTAIFTILFVAIAVVSLSKGGKEVVDKSILETLVALLFYGYTGIAVEKFTKRGIYNPPVQEEPDTEENKNSIKK